MVMKLILPLTLFALFLSACGQQSTPPPPTADPLTADTTPKAVGFQTEDQVNIKGTYYPPSNPQAQVPAILLVHKLDGNKESWQGLATAAQKAGYAVLAIDMRGHGESDGGKFHDQMVQDLDTALNWMADRPEIKGDSLGIVGASLGANLALQGGSRNPKVKSVVMLSPGLDYEGVTTVDALATYGQRAAMFVATENDTYAADSAQNLNSRALGQHQIQIYPGSQQGIDIFQAQVGLTPMVLAWFSSTL